MMNESYNSSKDPYRANAFVALAMFLTLMCLAWVMVNSVSLPPAADR